MWSANPSFFLAVTKPCVWSVTHILNSLFTLLHKYPVTHVMRNDAWLLCHAIIPPSRQLGSRYLALSTNSVFPMEREMKEKKKRKKGKKKGKKKGRKGGRKEGKPVELVYLYHECAHASLPGMKTQLYCTAAQSFATWWGPVLSCGLRDAVFQLQLWSPPAIMQSDVQNQSFLLLSAMGLLHAIKTKEIWRVSWHLWITAEGLPKHYFIPNRDSKII